jgi:hypothetical protein
MPTYTSVIIPYQYTDDYPVTAPSTTMMMKNPNKHNYRQEQPQQGRDQQPQVHARGSSRTSANVYRNYENLFDDNL